MSETVYTPPAGLRGKAARFAARTLAKHSFNVRPERAVVSFTFDDFPRSAMLEAGAQLEARGWRATFFTAGGFEGQRNHHGELFTADDLSRLAEAGHEIGCHTFSHRDARTASTSDFLGDIDQNAAFLGRCGVVDAPKSFAFPFGEATPSLKRALMSRFSAVRGVQPGINRGRADRALLKGTPLDGGLPGLQRAVDAVREVSMRPGWLIFYGHDIQDRPSEWGCTPEFFAAVVDAVAASGAEVLTMAEAVARLDADAS